MSLLLFGARRVEAKLSAEQLNGASISGDDSHEGLDRPHACCLKESERLFHPEFSSCAGDGRVFSLRGDPLNSRY